MKFAAVTLHLEGIDESQRAPKSSEHADAFIGSADMEKDDVLNSILLAPNRSVWVASDLSRLVAAVEAHKAAEQFNLLLCCMPSRDARTQPLSLSSVSKALGVFDLAVLERRRAVIGRIRGWRLFENNSHRSSAEACEALSRWNTLLSYLSRRCLSAITIRCGCAPSPIAEADLNEVLFIDGLFHCRGGNRPQSLEVPQPQLQLQPTICVTNSATEGKRTDALRTLRLSSFNSVVDDGYGRTSPSHLNALRALASAEHVNDVGKFPRLKTVFSAP